MLTSDEGAEMHLEFVFPQPKPRLPPASRSAMNIKLAYHWQPLTAAFSLWFEKMVHLAFVPRIGDGLVDAVGDETGYYTVKETAIHIQNGEVECWIKDDEMSDDRDETIAKFLALGWAQT